MQLQDKLWLFWRGGAWNPTFSYTTDGIHWVPARELVYFGHAQRPYTKYVTDGKRRIHGIFTDGHPENWKNSLHYARYENEALYAMDGRKLGTFKDIPLHTSKLDHIYNYSDAGGRAWGHDIALTADGPPARRLHAPGQQPRHLLVRLPQRHEVAEPQDRRGRGRAAVLPLRRRDPRPRGPARRLPLAHDRQLEPGRAVVHARTRAAPGRTAS